MQIAFKISAVAAAAAFMLSALPTAQAQSSIEKMKQMKVASADLNLPPVPQVGTNAEAIKKNLKKVTLPAGFKIELYAVVPDARHMAVAPSTNMLFVGTRKTTVWAVTDRNSDGIADEVKPFAPSLNFKNPNGVCWTKDGVLVVAEHNRVLTFPAAEFFYEGPDVAVGEVVPQGKLIPVDEESYNHGARTCKMGPDGKLYITMGQPHNVQPEDKIKLYESLGIGGVIRMDLDGGNREVIARGMRNPVGLAFNPKDNSIWTTDNQTDGMGDDTPPGELNRLGKVGAHYGYPWYSGRTKVTDAAAGYKLSAIPQPADIVWPQVELTPHAADLGLTFYSGKKFPAKYQGGIFIAEHGSWNRTSPVGYRVMFTSLKADGTADKTEVFADGFLDKETGIALGRPVDVAQLKDGSLLVSDDYVGAIYRISYAGE
jgi:glucose/arabinose dehydrogenase